MLPSVLDTTQVYWFKFYYNGQVWDSLRYNHNLYGLAYRFPKDSRRLAYQFACELAEIEASVLMVVGSDDYTVWLKLDANLSDHWLSAQQALNAARPSLQVLEDAECLQVA